MKVTPNKNRKYHFSPLRYPGGKTSLFPLFDNMMKSNSLRNITYVEPFAGGAGAALTLLLLEKVDWIVINDLDRAIYSFWQSALFDTLKFIDKLHGTPVTINEWQKQRAIYCDPYAHTFDLGFATFFLNRTNISGILNGGPIGGLNQNGKWKVDARFNKEKLSRRIHQVAAYKNRISVGNKNGVDLVKDFLGRSDVLIYLDPPYFKKGASLYLNHFKAQDHIALANVLNDSPDDFWLLTYDNTEEIKSLYSDRETYEFSLNYNAYRSRIGKEILILSDAFHTLT